MIVNQANLATLGIGFKATFQGALNEAPTDHASFVTEVQSSTSKEEYGWLGKIQSMRKWLGDRVIQNLKTHKYAIENEDFEMTVEVDRNDIADDNLGQYGMLFRDMGMSAGALPCELAYALLKAGFTTPCYDGQYMFDTDHPVIGADGAVTSVSNTGGGAGEPWFLIDNTRAVRPIILQNRQDTTFTSLDQPTDANVFMRKSFIYGAEARKAAGFGLWQLIYASKQPLTAANYAAARAALMGMKGDGGRALGIKPNLLLTGPANEGAGLKLMNNDLGANGESNEWKGTAKLQSSPWLA